MNTPKHRCRIVTMHRGQVESITNPYNGVTKTITPATPSTKNAEPAAASTAPAKTQSGPELNMAD